ncbi:hypothetical protein Salat_2528500 [Sesamum alatum]|uniref:Uncharacterized protein n=1 Tax=Sesamum alatum TaxID=300844 RepID=A0AAE1XS16_9LAMI|nr:hypothetical protein Salat_2528500 [Sesamum alatum]
MAKSSLSPKSVNIEVFSTVRPWFWCGLRGPSFVELGSFSCGWINASTLSGCSWSSRNGMQMDFGLGVGPFRWGGGQQQGKEMWGEKGGQEGVPVTWVAEVVVGWKHVGMHGGEKGKIDWGKDFSNTGGGFLRRPPTNIELR